MAQIFIDGAAGTTGLEIEARLAGRAGFTLIRLDAAARKDPARRAEALNAADVAILCLPDEAARDAVSRIANGRTRIIDASSAHRTAPGWTYGFPELGFDVAGAARLSNPGCYPTGFLALVAPLVRAGLIPADWPLCVHAASGYSGGGKALIARFTADEPDIALRSYALALGHKHVAEMQMHAGLTHPPVFSPIVVPAYRGMLVEVPLPLDRLPGAPSPAALRDCLAACFAGSPLIRVHDSQPEELLLRTHAAPSDRMDLYVAADGAGRQARLIAQLDNLGKGAAGACVQSLNLMLGLPMDEGLHL